MKKLNLYVIIIVFFFGYSCKQSNFRNIEIYNSKILKNEKLIDSIFIEIENKLKNGRYQYEQLDTTDTLYFQLKKLKIKNFDTYVTNTIDLNFERLNSNQDYGVFLRKENCSIANDTATNKFYHKCFFNKFLLYGETDW